MTHLTVNTVAGDCAVCTREDPSGILTVNTEKQGLRSYSHKGTKCESCFSMSTTWHPTLIFFFFLRLDFAKQPSWPEPSVLPQPFKH